MKRMLAVMAVMFFLTSSAYAHGGRTDKCGGHNDRKHGGYHIHNMAKHCNCYPDSPECKDDTADNAKKEKNEKEKKEEKERQ